jgi:hypothetical protein
VEIARYALIVATLGLCAVALLAPKLQQPREQAVIKAVLFVLVGMVFGVVLVLSTFDHLLGR